MRTSGRTVTFTRPFKLTGIDGMQPPGTYTVETDEERLPTGRQAADRRTGTWITLPSHAARAGPAQHVRIDPADLDAALAKDASAGWSPAAEANIDRMLAGSVLGLAVRSAGLTLRQFKEQLRDLAGRLQRTRPAPTDAGEGARTDDGNRGDAA
jgi:hypothetical protein